MKVRLNHYHWNPVTRKFISMELGNAKSTFTDIGSKVDHATNIANQANDTAKHASASADGKNTIYRDVKHEDIVNPVNGDTCFEKNGDKEEIWIYNGKSVPPSWELIVDDATGEEVRQNVDAAQKEAEEAKKKANDAVNQANQAVTDAGFANDTATQAKLDASAAGKQAKDALTDAKKALTDSSSAMADSAQAREESATAIKDAADSLTSAKDAISKVETLTTSVTSQFTTVDNELKSKVNQTDYDKLKGTVTSQQTEINQNASGIKLKADKSYADTINNSVVKNTSSIGLLNNQITLTVSKAELNNTLSSYATQTWTQGQIKTTADSINLNVSKVQTNLDNMQIGSRNLLIGTKDFSKGIYAGNGAVVTSEIYNGNRVLYEPKLTDANSYHNPYNMTTSINADATVYTVSFYAKSDVNGMVTQYYFYNPTNTISSINSQGRSSSSSDGLSELILSNNWEKYWITWTTTPSDSTKHIILGRRDKTIANSDIGGIYLTSPMFVEGNKPLPWSPAPEDSVTDVEFAELAVKVDGITATVANKADKTQITQLSNQISLKADTTALDELKGTVDKQGSEITLNTNSIKLKADQSSVNTLKGTVDKQGSAIDVNTKAIALKANQSTVDALTGRVSTAEGKIIVQAGQIAQTVSKTDLTNTLKPYATQTWTQSQIKSTADAINLNVSKVQTDLSGTNTQFAELAVKVDGIQTTVSGKADKSQVTQLAGQITSVVGSLNSPNLIPNSGMPTNTSFWSSNIPELFTVMGSLGGYTKGKMFSLMNVQGTDKVSACTSLIPVSRNTKYTFSFLILGSDNVFGYDVWFLGRPFGETKPFTTQHQLINNLKPKPNYEVDYKTVTFTTGDDDEGYIRVDNNGSTASGQSVIFFTEVKLERGEKATPWDQTAEGTELIQTRNDINLRVEKGKVINQINISPEGILIAGQKVHITGQTRIDNAVIKDAMIADIKADKITAGTLNAANVDVINLNANNITTGAIKGANLSLNLNTGEVVFQHGRIHSASNNIDVNIDQGYLSTASSNTRVMLKEGQLQLVQPTIFDNSKDPYLQISNSIGGASFNGANIIARDYLVLANRANSDGFFDAPLDEPETFAGLAVGKTSAGRWKPTRIGGAERGIIMRGGTAYKIDSSFMYKESPAIFVGTDGAGLKPSDRIYINGSYVHITSAYWRTASGSANLMVAQDGALVRSTSASKYKTDIIRTNIPDYGEKLLELPTATWTDIAETKRYRDDPATQPEPTRNFGMIAEDLAEAGLEMLVVRGTDGELEGINYDRIGPALIPVIAKLKNEVETLKQQLEEKTA